MKTSLLTFAALLPAAAFASQATITVTHDLATARPGEVIVIPYAELLRVLPDARMYHVVVRNAATGAAVPVQMTNYEHDHKGFSPDNLVFQHDFAAGEKAATFVIETSAETTPPVPPRVFARYVPERWDDFAWENDRIAHRVYGPVLNTAVAGNSQLRSSGIDIWAKRVSFLIVDRWYLKGHDQFHKDNEGEGLDVYNIGRSRGAGGTGVWDGTKLHTSDNFAAWRVLANGPLRAIFELDYASWETGGGKKVAETKRFTVDAGRNFTAVESTFTFEGADPITVGLGLTVHPNMPGTLATDPKGRWLSLWEVSKDGGLGVAVILAPECESVGFASEPLGSAGAYGNQIILAKATSGGPLRYHIGAGWDRSGQFASREDWERYIADFAARVASPVKVSIAAAP